MQRCGHTACKWADMQVKIICLVLSQTLQWCSVLISPRVMAQTRISTAGIDLGLEINTDVIIWPKTGFCGVGKCCLKGGGVFGVYTFRLWELWH